MLQHVIFVALIIYERFENEDQVRRDGTMCAVNVVFECIELRLQ